ncbi:LacI family DNA-binding transcriptional regulator [Levilactobacillus suantsaiihabitans]|uniref:LacI family transcriptional regulator n=1 Tax=Levilactobacillus suantsaiihabitans TaxID=2487722 RepID=A0A4Z0J706_9LACO|nr:LacI family DNA-binding transcriptional regulator [Levilactobacillus suantsaiihabitans]TGD18321.1 LacI family transcriptional regulator [Levilactobacillus suantsaiihabitans]
MAATIKDIAKLAGVSTATVSRVLAHKTAFFSAATAQKVQAAAATLGYQKNTAAAELVTRQSHVIAAVVNSTKTNFASQIIEGIQAEAHRHDLNVIILYAGDADAEQQRRALMTVIERPVMGILLLSVDLAAENLTLLQQSQLPYCFLSISFDGERLPYITSDDWQVGYLATQALLDQGHRRIGLAGVDSDFHTGRLRVLGYTQALKNAGITAAPDWIQLGNYSYAAGQTAMRAYGAKTSLTAVVGASDMAAIGVMNQARDLGLAVPTDLSIIAIDGTELCSLVQPSLTSVSQNFYEMGIAGVQQLRAKEALPQKITPIQLVNRQSVRRLNGDRK